MVSVTVNLLGGTVGSEKTAKNSLLDDITMMVWKKEQEGGIRTRGDPPKE